MNKRQILATQLLLTGLALSACRPFVPEATPTPPFYEENQKALIELSERLMEQGDYAHLDTVDDYTGLRIENADTFQEVFERSANAIVMIRTEYVDGDFEYSTAFSIGHDDHLIYFVTTSHSLIDNEGNGFQSIKFLRPNNDQAMLDLGSAYVSYAWDTESDLAVVAIPIQGNPLGITSLPLAENPRIRKGRQLLSMGYNRATTFALTSPEGNVTGLRGVLFGDTGTVVHGANGYGRAEVNFIPTAIGGNSGSPILNRNGEVKGVVTGYNTNTGMTMITPLNDLPRLVDMIREGEMDLRQK